jgi:hypothetical protein
MRWKKIGKIFSTDSNFGWMNSHAQIPTVIECPNFLRIFFATRPSVGLSVVACVDVDKEDPRKIVKLHRQPSHSGGFFDLFILRGLESPKRSSL